MPTNDKLVLLILTLAKRLGREPTEDEVIDFILGDNDTRQSIWNKGRV